MLEIQVTYTLRCRQYFHRLQVDEALLGSGAASWLYKYFLALQRDSQQRPLLRSTVQCIVTALKLLATERSWQSLRKTNPANITPAVVMTVFRLLERKLLRTNLATGGKKTISMCFRKMIKDCLRLRQDFPRHHMDSLDRFYRSSIHRNTHARALVSDMVHPGDGANRHPIGALPHIDVKELKRQTSARIKNSLASIEQACREEFEEFERTTHWLQDARQYPISPEERRIVESAVGSKTGRNYLNYRQLTELDIRTVLAGYLSLVERTKRFAMTRQNKEKLNGYPLGNALARYATSWSGHEFKTFKTVALYPHIGDGRLLLACLLALMLQTGWNTSSVLELTLTSIRSDADETLIQGYKRRTDDHTPIVYITKKDVGARWALDFLQHRLTNLKLFKLVSEESESLWLSAGFNSSHEHVHTIFPKSLKDFQRRHQLPRFSLEQIRPEVLAAALIDGNEEDSRHQAGHRSISMTGHYMDQLLLARLNSAINLEFQRRLEKSVRWLLKRDDYDLPPQSLLPRAIPVGDGSSCRDPAHPPAENWLVDDQCDARSCHQGEGCPNRVIEIDRTRIDEVVRTGFFYRRSWQSLREENVEAFERVHVPAIIFNEVLSNLIRNGPYGFVLKEAQSRYEGEMEWQG